MTLHQPVWNVPNPAAPSQRNAEMEEVMSAPHHSTPRRRSEVDTAPLQMVA